VSCGHRKGSVDSVKTDLRLTFIRDIGLTTQHFTLKKKDK